MEPSTTQDQWEDQEPDGADVVQRDALQLLGVRGWRRRAENRDEWWHALREAKARKGL